nr:DNA polymerase IV [Sphingomonas mesophila]
MDAFYASVEQRDDPALRGRPVAVGGGHRGVVAAASYEARAFGVRSAMPSVTARRRCPDLIFVKPRFEVYKAVSQQIRAIFADFTDAIEPLSLDEAYLDVSEDRLALGSARAIAERIRARIRAETGLTASAGVSYCKFIAKLASDQNKPDGLCVIPPARGAAFVAALPVGRFHGVGPKTAERMERLGIVTGADLAAWTLAELEAHFGSSGQWYYRIARGIDEREVRSNRELKSASAERTFDTDFSEAADLHRELERVAGLAWQRIARAGVIGRTVTLKVKYADFTLITRSQSFAQPVRDEATFAAAGAELLARLLPVPKGVRLLGLGLHALVREDDGPQQLGLAI